MIKYYQSFVEICVEDTPVILVGNKRDLVTAPPQLEELGVLGRFELIEISVKNQENLLRPFQQLISKLKATPELAVSLTNSFTFSDSRLMPVGVFGSDGDGF